MALQNINKVVEQTDDNNDKLLDVYNAFNSSQLDPSNPDYKPFYLKSDSPISISSNSAIPTTGGYTIRGMMKGFDFTGKLWNISTTYNQSVDTTSIFARTNWQTVNTNVKTEYFGDDGTYTVNTLPTEQFLLGDPHGPTSSRAYLGSPSSFPTTEPIDTSTNILSIDNTYRYDNVFIYSNITVLSYFAYKTYLNGTLQTVVIPTGVFSYELPLSKGDYFTEGYIYCPDGSNTGVFTLNFSGYQWLAPPVPHLPIDLKAFLQMPIFSGSGEVFMNSGLNGSALIPNDSSDVYTSFQTNDIASPMFPNLVSYVSDDVNSLDFTGSGPYNPIIDWVVVCLRDATTMNYVYQSQTAIICGSGKVCTITGDPVEFTNQVPGDYRVSIHHRNHVPVISNIITMNTTSNSYDFTTSLSQATSIGGDPDQMVQYGTGPTLRWCMWGGDVTSNWIVDGTSASVMSATLASPPSGYDTGIYHLCDTNLDGFIDSTDAPVVTTNAGLNIYTTLLNYV